MVSKTLAVIAALAGVVGLASCGGQQNANRYKSSTGMDFVLLEAGTFEMGSTEDVLDAQPPHMVTLTRDYYMAATEVTFEVYDLFAKESRARKAADFGWGRGNLPVVDVLWIEAVRFCNWLSNKDGFRPVYQIQGGQVTWLQDANGYRLPTEAEWEYAARGGPVADAHRFAGGDDPADVAWFYDNSGLKNHPVGLKKPNSFGLFDMSGNVSEYCWDWSAPYDPGGKAETDPVGPRTGTTRAVRGGSQITPALTLPIWRRAAAFPNSRTGDRGFRVVRTASAGQ